ncbi:MAG TPA: ABC-2 family transporter protein [Fibrobacteria bacterium]|nr:ABC-2 family transporter protein [Fibrobacteria bacterium]
MLRYLRLYGHFMRFSISRALEFRIDFFFRVFMDLAYYGIQIAFYQVVFLQTPLLGGWDSRQTFIFMSGFLVVDAITMTVVSNNLWFLPVAVNRGDLDYYLVRPVSSLFFLSLRDFAANSFLNLLFAIGIFAWALSRASFPLTFASVSLYLAMLLAGAFLHYMMHLIIILPVFWLQSGSGLHAIFYSMSRFMERPDRIFTGWVRKVLVTVFPFCLMASFPARLFLEGLRWEVLAHFLAVTAGVFGAILLIWRAGLRAYSSASS